MKCKDNSINFKELENTILQIINVFVNNFLDKEKNEIYISDKIKNINYELNKINEEKILIYELYLNEDLTKEDYIQKKKFYNKKKN